MRLPLTTCTCLKVSLSGQNPVIGSGIFLCIAIDRSGTQRTKVSAVVKVPCSAHSSSLLCSWDLDWNALKPQQRFPPITSKLWLCPSCPAAQVALGHDSAWFVLVRSSPPNNNNICRCFCLFEVRICVSEQVCTHPQAHGPHQTCCRTSVSGTVASSGHLSVVLDTQQQPQFINASVEATGVLCWVEKCPNCTSLSECGCPV